MKDNPRIILWDREQLAWAAGLFEGEGCVRAAKDSQSQNKYEGRTYLDVSQSEREVLDRFRDIMGFGTVYGPYPKPNRKPYYRYMLATYECSQMAVILMWPWLSSRRKAQAAAAFKTCQTLRQKGQS